MSSQEFTQWRALIEIVEPHEREQERASSKTR